MRRKKNKSKKLLKAEEEHARFLQKMGIRGLRKSPRPLTVAPWRGGGPSSPLEGAPRSHPFTGDPCYKKDKLNEHRWKRGKQESSKTVEAMVEKSKRIAPLYNKGPYQLTTSKDDIAAGRRRG